MVFGGIGSNCTCTSSGGPSSVNHLIPAAMEADLFRVIAAKSLELVPLAIRIRCLHRLHRGRAGCRALRSRPKAPPRELSSRAKPGAYRRASNPAFQPRQEASCTSSPRLQPGAPEAVNYNINADTVAFEKAQPMLASPETILRAGVLVAAAVTSPA